jgi:hypothetical protein
MQSVSMDWSVGQGALIRVHLANSQVHCAGILGNLSGIDGCTEELFDKIVRSARGAECPD